MRLFAAAAVAMLLAACSEEAAPPIGSDAPNVEAAKKPAARFVCREYDRATNALKQRTVVLQQKDGLGLTEGEKLAFDLEVYEGASVIPVREASGIAETEDVNFAFTSSDGAVTFRTFFDELEESSLTLDGADAGDFVCSRGEIVCHQYDRQSDALLQRTVVLVNRDEKPIVEGEKIPFSLESWDGSEQFRAESVDGVVETEDVMFFFTSTDGKTSFRHFMDEINEASMSIAGADAGDYICR